MTIINGCNDQLVDFFDLDKYVKQIELEDGILEHLEETNKTFHKYFTELLQYDSYAVIYYLIDNLSKEFANSQAIEHKTAKILDAFQPHNAFFDTLTISRARINKLHDYATQYDKKKTKDYRTTPVRVSVMTPLGEKIFWHGAKPEDVERFMIDFIKIYKKNNIETINASPFLKSALVHLLFVRIHPYTDGNGRTARMIQNIKFTESINRLYGMNLKICPINISQNILINKVTYAKRINSIYFDDKHETNDSINKWFDFILHMFDEQLYYGTNRLKENSQALEQIAKMEAKSSDSKTMRTEINKMKLKKIKQ